MLPLLPLLCALLASGVAQTAYAQADAVLVLKNPSGRKLLLNGAHLHAGLGSPCLIAAPQRLTAKLAAAWAAVGCLVPADLHWLVCIAQTIMTQLV